MSTKVAKLVEEIKGLTLMEAAEVAKTLKEDLNLPDAAPMMMAGPAAAAAAPAGEEQTEFAVELTEVPADKKIAVLKEVRAITGLGLGEAKEIVESTPKVLKEGVSKADADAMKKQIEAAGGKVTLK